MFIQQHGLHSRYSGLLTKWGVRVSYYNGLYSIRNKLNFDIIDHKENGYLSKPFDIDDLNNGIEWILNLDKNIYNQLCDNARNKHLLNIILLRYQINILIYIKILLKRINQ